MSKWELSRLGDLGKIVTGNTPKTSDESNYSSKDICFFKPSDIGEGKVTRLNDSEYWISEYGRGKVRMLPKNSVLVTCIGTIGKVGILDCEATCNQQINAIIPNEDVDSSALAYAILSRKVQMQAIANAPVVPIINKTQFSDIKIPLPPLDVQKHIANVLDKIQEIIDGHKKQLEELDNLIKATFYDMFGEPIHNPKKWNTRYIGDLFTVASGGTPKTSNKEYWDNGDVSWIGSNMCQNEILYKNDGKYITQQGLKSSSAKMFPCNTVLVALVGATIGKVALLKFETATNQNVAGIYVGENNRFKSEYIYYMLQSLYYKFTELGNGGFKMANLSFIRGLEIMLPPLELQNKFAQIVTNIEEQKSLVKQSITQSQNLFNSLMSKYFD